MMSPTPEVDTPELLRRARAGDGESLALLLTRFWPQLMTRVRLLMGPDARRTADSADFLQGAFVEVIETLPRYDLRDESAFLRWATRIARNNILDHVRKNRERAIESFVTSSGLFGRESQDTPSGDAVESERVELLIDALTQMREEYQEAIELRWFEGLPFAEVGRRTGRSEEAARAFHARALIQLGVGLKRLGVG